MGSSRVFVPAADPLFCSAKKVGQKRRPLRWRSALRTDCTRRQGLKREASETRCAQTADASLSVSVPGDASPSNGDPLQRPLQLQLQLQLSLRGQLQLSLRGQLQRSLRGLNSVVQARGFAYLVLVRIEDATSARRCISDLRLPAQFRHRVLDLRHAILHVLVALAVVVAPRWFRRAAPASRVSRYSG